MIRLFPILVLIAGCATHRVIQENNVPISAKIAETSVDRSKPQSEQKNDPLREAYDKCLQDNMAVAMAWEMIEQRCQAQTGWTLNADPLAVTQPDKD